MNAPIIEVKNLGKRYRLGQFGAGSLREEIEQLRDRILRKDRKKEATSDFWALRNVSFEVNQGDVVGVIGRNGAGKSTLLKLLSRITEPTEGEAFIRGRVVSLLEVGTGFHPELSGRDNIYLNGTILGMTRSEIKERFDEIVDFAGTREHIDTPVKRYSSGMIVRLGFAIAAHFDLEIMIVDEVLAVGDIAFQTKCVEKMRQAREKGTTILFVSHNMELVSKLCRRAILLEHGKITASGATHDIIQKYYEKSDYIEPNREASLSHFDHIGTGEACFTKLKMEAPDGQDAIYPLKPISFTLTIEANEPLEMDRFALYLSTLSDLKLVNCEISTMEQTLSLKEGTNMVRVTMDQLFLNPGEYAIGLSMSHRKIEKPVDRMHNILRFAVINDPENKNIRSKWDGLINVPYSVQRVN